MAYRALIVVAFGVLLGACGPSEPASDGGGAPAAAASVQPRVIHSAVGTFNSIDRAAGTINISHEAVPSAQWPAMTMDFHIADSISSSDLEPGQRIAFEFTTDDDGTVTKIEPVP